MIALDQIKYKKTDEKPCLQIFSVQIPGNLVQTAEAEVVKRIQKVAQLPGFRLGKAPEHLVRQNFKEKLKNQTFEQILQDVVPQILKAKEIDPVSYPMAKDMQWKDDSSLSFSLEVEHRPEYKVSDYNKIAVKLKKKPADHKEKELQQALDKIRERYAELAPSSAKKIGKEHFAVVNFEGWVDGAALAELKAENELVQMNANQSIEGLTEGLLGMAKEEAKDIVVPFPADHPHKKLAGKSVTFKVQVKDIKERKLPALDDEFAKDIGAESLADLHKKINESLEKSIESQTAADTERQINIHLLKENPIPVPTSQVERQLERLLVETLRSRYGENIPPQEREKVELEVPALQGQLKPKAEEDVRLSYLYAGIAKQEKLQATDEDWTKELEQTKASVPDDVKRVEEYFHSRKEQILARLTERKVLEFLKSHAKIKEVDE